jgi:hypothetical protein
MIGMLSTLVDWACAPFNATLVAAAAAPARNLRRLRAFCMLSSSFNADIKTHLKALANNTAIFPGRAEALLSEPFKADWEGWNDCPEMASESR